MKKLALFLVPLLLCLLSTNTSAQHRKYPVAPPPMNEGMVNATPEPVNSQKRIDLLQLQREADDLARAAQTIPSDVASVRKGMLPKDVIQKLKQIEKLSKRLRSQLNP